MNPPIKKYRQSIAKRVKELRRERRLTQKELADYLGLSQNRVSQIEAGQGSFSAEHLLLLSKKFNIPASSFVDEKIERESAWQDALARLGARHLVEHEITLPSEELNDIVQLVREVLGSSKSSRSIAALAPVIVRHAESPLLNRLRLILGDDGLIRRYGWLLENIRWAIDKELAEDLPREWQERYKKADFILKNLLAFPKFSWREITSDEDVLDSDVWSEKSLPRLRESSSNIAKRWKIITRITPEDFANALRDGREIN